MKKRLLSMLVCLVMVLGFFPAPSLAAGAQNTSPVFSDMPDNWSTQALQNAVENGLLYGTDGKIMPNDNLSRAQMGAVIVRAFGASAKGDISAFADVKPTDWFADDMAKAYQMGVIRGSGGKMNPNGAITRQEVFVILARALKLAPAETVNRTFSDAGELADWAKGEVYALVNAGYIQGSDGKLAPAAFISRAQFAQVMDNIVAQYIKQAGRVTQVSAGNVMVSVPSVTLKDLTVSGDLIVGDGVGDGEIILENVKITGRMVVRGGGENSVIIRGSSSVSSVIVSRTDGAVSVKVEGDADVEVIYVDDGSDDVIIQGAVGTVEIAAPGIAVTAVGASIDNITLTGANSTLVVGSGSTVGSVGVGTAASNASVQVTGTVTTITTSAPGTQVSGTGTVTQVLAQQGAAGASIETPKTEIVVQTGVTGVTGGGGTGISGGSTANNNETGTGTTIPAAGPPSGGGGGGDDTPTTAVTGVSITGNAVAGAALTAAPAPSGATVSYQWKRCDTETGAYADISGATSATYTCSPEDAGKYLKVTAAGTGSYSGSVTSGATAAVVGIAATPIAYDPSASLTGVSNTVTLYGATFADAASAQAPGNWNIETGDTNLAVFEIRRTGDHSAAIDYTLKTSSGGTGAGTVTIQAKAAAISASLDTNAAGVSIAREITAADVSVTSGSVVFDYSFYDGTVPVTYTAALGAPYYLNTNLSTVTLSDGTHTSAAVSVAQLGISGSGAVTYASPAAAAAAFGNITFIPTTVTIYLEGGQHQRDWSITEAVTLSANEMSLLDSTKPVVNASQNMAYSTVAEAIDAAAEGNTIAINPGTYSEPITVTNKSLTLRGTDGTVLTGGIIATATGAGKSLTVSGITFQRAGLEANGYDTVIIQDNTFSNICFWTPEQLAGNVANAIYVHGSDTGTVQIAGNTVSGVACSDAGHVGDGMGIMVRDLNNIAITDNVISDTWHNSINIYQGIAGPVSITGNTLSNWDSNQDSASDTTIARGCEGGRALRLALETGTTLTVTGNSFAPNNFTTPVDPNYVKITGYGGNVSSLIYSLDTGNTWPSGVNYEVVILVNTTHGAKMAAGITGGDYYPTIQTAIDEAVEGNTIAINPGTYSEPITVTNKSLTVSGADGTVLTGGIIATATGAGKSLTVSGITFQTAGLEVKGYDTVTVENNTFTEIVSWTADQYADGSADAIYVHGSTAGAATIRNNTISGVRSSTTNIGDGMGITVLDLDNVTISGNTISNTWHNSINIYQGIAGPVSITGNTLSNWDSNQDSASDTTIARGCEGGRALRLALETGTTLTVTGNSFAPNNFTTPVDPNYVKITGYGGNVSSLIYSLDTGNTWPSGVNYEVVILVNTTHGAKMAAGITSGAGTNYYPTIQAAIDAAAPGNTITVCAGTHSESLSIGKSLTIHGVNAANDATTSAFLEAGSIVTGGIVITAGDVAIRGLTLQGKGILASNITGLTLENNTIRNIGTPQTGAPGGSVVGLDIKTLATGPIVIQKNRFSDIGVTDGTGTAVRIVRASDSITISDNIMERMTKNAINLYSNCLAEESAVLTITGNEIIDWDSDRDDNAIGGRAIRIDFAGAAASATAVITGNKLTPPTYTSEQTPVDSQYVKLTEVGIAVDLTLNYWGSALPDFSTILLVETVGAGGYVSVPYYTDEAMTTTAP